MEMTKEEAREFLTERKVFVGERTQEVQEKLFSLGLRWGSGDQKLRNMPGFLYLHKDGITWGSDYSVYRVHKYLPLQVEDILSIEIKPSEYRPFKNAEECLKEMQNHQPFGYVKAGEGYSFVSLCYDKVYYAIDPACVQSLEEAFLSVKFFDGEPFGIRVNNQDK